MYAFTRVIVCDLTDMDWVSLKISGYFDACKKEVLM